MINNTTKVWIFILTTSLAFLIFGYKVADRLGLLIGFLGAFTLNFFVFFYGESRILGKLKAVRMRGQDPWDLHFTVAQFCSQLRMPVPSIYVVNHSAVNAFCVGNTWKKSSLGFTTGMLERLTKPELEAVIAHQLCHIRRLDTFAFSVSSTLANAVVGVGQFLDSLIPYRTHFFRSLFSPLGWIIIKGVVGEKSFFENDRMASILLSDRQLLGEVLWRIEGLAQTKPFEVPPCTSHLFIVNPEGFQQKNLFLKSHPSIENRLQRLMGYYPI